MKGRKPKPTALKIAQGNPGGKPLPKNEPKPTPGMPDPPAMLGSEERAVWDRFVPELLKMGVLAKVHGDMIASYCRAVVQERLAAAALAEQGHVVKTRYGQRVNPWFRVMQDAEKRRRAIAVEFGLTPASQARASKVEVESNEEPDDPALRLLKRANAARTT